MGSWFIFVLRTFSFKKPPNSKDSEAIFYCTFNHPVLKFYELRATLNVRSRPNSYYYFITPMFIVKLVFYEKYILIKTIFPQNYPCKTPKTEHLPIDKMLKVCYNGNMRKLAYFSPRP